MKPLPTWRYLAAAQTVQAAGAQERIVGRLRRLNDQRRAAILADRLATQAVDAITANTVSVGTGLIMLLGAGSLRDGTADARLRRYLQPDLLILDDFGMRAFSEQQTEDLWELIGERRHCLIVVSNRAPQDWYALFPNPVLAESVLDRLINNAHHLILSGHSYRPQRRPDRAQAGVRSGADPEHTEPEHDEAG